MFVIILERKLYRIESCVLSSVDEYLFKILTEDENKLVFSALRNWKFFFVV